MTREELVELVYSLNKEIEGLQKDLDVYKGWKIERRMLAYWQRRN